MSKKKDTKEEAGFKVSVVKHLPPVARKSKYDKLFDQVPDEGMLAVEFEAPNKARNLRSSLRGYLKSRDLTGEYNVDRRGNVVYISKSSYTDVYPESEGGSPTAEDVKEDEDK